jgi:hypothetical protein
MRVLLLVYLAILVIVTKGQRTVGTVSTEPAAVQRTDGSSTASTTGATGTSESTGAADATGTTVNMDDPNPPKFVDPEGPMMKKIEEKRKADADKRIAKHRDEARQNIIGVLDTAIKQTTTYSNQQKAACTVEIKATDEWQQESSGKAAEAARAQRNEAKKALKEAIIGRESVLKEFLAKLEAGKQKLGHSIRNTNNIYTHIYDTNRQTEVNARNALHALTIGIVPDGKLLPFQPIKEITGHEHVDQGMTLYKPSNANPGSATGGAAADNAEAASTTTNTFLQIDAFKVENRRAHYDTVLMELEAGLHKKATGCDLKECETAYMAIYEIIKQVYLHDCVNFKLFDEKSRVPLRKYADGLKHMIEVRKAKLVALGKQREALTRSINGEGQTLAGLFPLIKKHAETLDVACKKMPTNTERMLVKLKATKADAEAKRLMCSPDGSAPAGADSSESSSATGASSSSSSASESSSASSSDSSASGTAEDKTPASSSSDASSASGASSSDASSASGPSSPLNSEFDSSGASGASSSSGASDSSSDSVLDSTPTKQEQAQSQTESVPGNQPPSQQQQ